MSGYGTVLHPASADITRRARLVTLRNVGCVQAATGLALVLAPGPATRAACGGGAAPPNWIVRLLGARMSAQGVAIASRPGPLIALAGATADGAHAASMLLVPRWVPRYRRVAVFSAALASGFAAALVACAGPPSEALRAAERVARRRGCDDETDGHDER